MQQLYVAVLNFNEGAVQTIDAGAGHQADEKLCWQR